ncbi:ferritin-like domain-containing protein [Hymenobacter rigui]|uniref:Ferritin-like domain-containing protein n=1 Tax=Hymenobacter rigui TaxID=334424 RepID=A0A3R9MVV2_9BACT|nr:ferritin-like domain-containing protein [Hymenobacter rigui]RSK51313.1 ferritin-like domain-containing protein [Hymenobacter rigui]
MHLTSFLERTLQRRSFLRVAGATAASSALVLAGCGSDDNPKPTNTTASLTFSSNDNGLLNFAYLLEQIEATFYQKVVDAFPSDFTAEDKAAFIDLRDHEVIHREFLRFALGGNAYDLSLPGAIIFNFSSFTLTTRAGVYAAARTLEDIGVAAYNGAVKRISDAGYLALLSKLSSVEARHAAFVREQAQPGSFAGADVIGTTDGLDIVKTPMEVAALLAPIVPLTLVTDGLTNLS